MRAVWLPPEVVLETALYDVLADVLAALEVRELLLVLTVLEVPAPPPCRRYPPNAATTKATTTMTTATVVETPVLERRNSSQLVTVIVPFIVDAYAQ
jgi:hypothetical protein